MSKSEAIRSALIESAGRLRRRSAFAAEMAGLEADDSDRQQMVAVAELMESSTSVGEVDEGLEGLLGVVLEVLPATDVEQIVTCCESCLQHRDRL